MCKGYKKDIFGSFAYEFELLRFLSEAQGFTLRDAMLSHRDVAHFVRSDVMFGATRQRRASRTAGVHHGPQVCITHAVCITCPKGQKNDRSKPVVFSVYGLRKRYFYKALTGFEINNT